MTAAAPTLVTVQQATHPECGLLPVDAAPTWLACAATSRLFVSAFDGVAPSDLRATTFYMCLVENAADEVFADATVAATTALFGQTQSDARVFLETLKSIMVNAGAQSVATQAIQDYLPNVTKYTSATAQGGNEPSPFEYKGSVYSFLGELRMRGCAGGSPDMPAVSCTGATAVEQITQVSFKVKYTGSSPLSCSVTAGSRSAAVSVPAVGAAVPQVRIAPLKVVKVGVATSTQPIVSVAVGTLDPFEQFVHAMETCVENSEQVIPTRFLYQGYTTRSRTTLADCATVAQKTAMQAGVSDPGVQSILTAVETVYKAATDWYYIEGLNSLINTLNEYQPTTLTSGEQATCTTSSASAGSLTRTTTIGSVCSVAGAAPVTVTQAPVVSAPATHDCKCVVAQRHARTPLTDARFRAALPSRCKLHSSSHRRRYRRSSQRAGLRSPRARTLARRRMFARSCRPRTAGKQSSSSRRRLMSCARPR